MIARAADAGARAGARACGCRPATRTSWSSTGPCSCRPSASRRRDAAGRRGARRLFSRAAGDRDRLLGTGVGPRHSPLRLPAAARQNPTMKNLTLASAFVAALLLAGCESSSLENAMPLGHARAPRGAPLPGLRRPTRGRPTRRRRPSSTRWASGSPTGGRPRAKSSPSAASPGGTRSAAPARFR